MLSRWPRFNHSRFALAQAAPSWKPKPCEAMDACSIRGMLRSVCTVAWQATMQTSKLHIQWHHINNLKSAVVGIFFTMETCKLYTPELFSLSLFLELVLSGFRGWGHNWSLPLSGNTSVNFPEPTLLNLLCHSSFLSKFHSQTSSFLYWHSFHGCFIQFYDSTFCLYGEDSKMSITAWTSLSSSPPCSVACFISPHGYVIDISK